MRQVIKFLSQYFGVPRQREREHEMPTHMRPMGPLGKPERTSTTGPKRGGEGAGKNRYFALGVRQTCRGEYETEGRILGEIEPNSNYKNAVLQPFNNWLDGTREDLVDMFIVHTMEEIQGLIDAHNQFKATLGEADKEYNSIVSLVTEVETTVQKHTIPGGLANPYTTLTATVGSIP